MIEWLRTQLDEDEQAARAATTGPWRHDPAKHWRKPGTSWFEEAVFAGSTGADATCVAGTGETDDPQSTADAAHIARHDPARVLADVDANRRILDRHEQCGTGCGYCDDAGGGWRLDDGTPVCGDKLDLARRYADRPGYRSEWAPNDGPRPT